MRPLYAGLDVGSRVCSLAVIDHTGTCVFERTVPTSEQSLIGLIREARQRCRGNFSLVLEEGEMAHWVAGILRPEATEVAICDPKQNRWIAKDPHKSDPFDARKLAQLLRGGFVKRVYHTEDDERWEFKRVVQHYHRMTAQQADGQRQIKSVYRSYGILVVGAQCLGPDLRERFLPLVPTDFARQRLRHLYATFDHTRKIQREAFQLMVAFGRRFPEVDRFQEVPGIGPVWACTFAAYVHTPRRFANQRKLWSYCCLGIRDRRSDGKPLGYEKLDGNGVGMLKRLSYQAFCAAIKGDNEFRSLYRASIRRTGNPTHARLNIQRKILTVLYVMWKRNEGYRPFGGRKELDRETDKR